MVSQQARAYQSAYKYFRAKCRLLFIYSRGIFTNIDEPEANNCFSIITQVIIEIPKQRSVKFYHNRC